MPGAGNHLSRSSDLCRLLCHELMVMADPFECGHHLIIRHGGFLSAISIGMWNEIVHSEDSHKLFITIDIPKDLMRHASIQTTMNIYGKAMTDSKRQAHSKVVEMVLNSSKSEKTAYQEKPVAAIGRYWEFFGSLRIRATDCKDWLRGKDLNLRPLGYERSTR